MRRFLLAALVAAAVGFLAGALAPEPTGATLRFGVRMAPPAKAAFEVDLIDNWTRFIRWD